MTNKTFLKQLIAYGFVPNSEPNNYNREYVLVLPKYNIFIDSGLSEWSIYRHDVNKLYVAEVNGQLLSFMRRDFLKFIIAFDRMFLPISMFTKTKTYHGK